MAENSALRAEIRACIREELAVSASPQQSLIQRTRSLIQQSALSASRDIAINSGSISSNNNSSNNRASKRPSPGHSLRFGFRKKSKPENEAKKKVIPKTVYLLDEADLDDEEEYTLTDSMILLKGEFDLSQDENEEAIRTELCSLFQTKYPYIRNKDFDFVKRERNKISRPVTKKGHTWGFDHVKHLCGTGKLYVRLNIAKETLNENEDDEGEPETISTTPSSCTNAYSSASNQLYGNPHTLSTSSSADDSIDVEGRARTPSSVSSSTTRKSTTLFSSSAANSSSSCQPSGNSRSLSIIPIADDNTDDEDRDLTPSGVCSSRASNLQIENLRAVFPNIPAEFITRTVTECGDVNAAVNRLLQLNPSSTTHDQPNNVEKSGFKNASEVLQFLRSTHMSHRGMRERIKIDQGEEVMDLYAYYKSPDFDPTYPLSICLRGQPAVDTGGVLRQVFDSAFASLANNEGVENIFVGHDNKRMPAYRSELVMNGFFEVLGKMIAHSMVQGGPGFTYFSPVMYSYIASGDLCTSLEMAIVEDVDDPDLLEYIEKINKATDAEIETIAFESDFIRIMAEAGEIRLFTAANKLDILQSLMIHNVLVKRKAVLDQLRKGLSILGLLDKIEKYPELFQENFVHQGDVTPEGVIGCLRFAETEKNSERRVYQILLNFIKGSNANELDAFLKFVAGASTMAKGTLPRKISVSCSSSDSIFSSVCIMSLKLPSHFSTAEDFNNAMKSVLDSQKFSTG